MRTLAQLDTTLQSYLGAPGNIFRWFDTQLPQGRIKQGPCITVIRVSEVGYYAHRAGRFTLAGPRFQFDILGTDPEELRALGAYMKTGFLQNADLSTPNIWGCPTVAPIYPAPNTVLNYRGGLLYQVEPPIWRELLDVRIWNREDV